MIAQFFAFWPDAVGCRLMRLAGDLALGEQQDRLIAEGALLNEMQIQNAPTAYYRTGTNGEAIRCDDTCMQFHDDLVNNLLALRTDVSIASRKLGYLVPDLHIFEQPFFSTKPQFLPRFQPPKPKRPLWN